MYVMATCMDAPETGEKRAETRPDHLAFLDELGDRVKLGGPILAEDGETPVGSFLILEVENLAEAEALLADDPYRMAGVFETVDLKPWRGVLGAWWPGETA